MITSTVHRIDNDNQIIGVAIGDVAGHGISSALLMATVRSSLRQRDIVTWKCCEALYPMLTISWFRM